MKYLALAVGAFVLAFSIGIISGGAASTNFYHDAVVEDYLKINMTSFTSADPTKASLVFESGQFSISYVTGKQPNPDGFSKLHKGWSSSYADMAKFVGAPTGILDIWNSLDKSASKKAQLTVAAVSGVIGGVLGYRLTAKSEPDLRDDKVFAAFSRQPTWAKIDEEFRSQYWKAINLHCISPPVTTLSEQVSGEETAPAVARELTRVLKLWVCAPQRGVKPSRGKRTDRTQSLPY